MRTVLSHVLVCSFSGAVLAAVVGAGWQHVCAAVEPLTLMAVGLLGAVTAGLGAGFVSVLQQRPRRELPLHKHGPVRRVKPALRARVSARYRWQAVSRELCRLLRRPARALRTRPIFEALHPEDYGAVDQALLRAQASGKPQVVLCRFLVPVDVPNGEFARTTFRTDTDLLPPLDPATFRHVRLRLRARRNEAGKVVDFACRFVDVSPPEELRREVVQARYTVHQGQRKLRRINADLSRLKESYHELYHHAPVMYFRLDVEGRLVAFNDTLLRTLGYRRDELRSHSYAELLEPVAGRPPALPRGQAPFEEGQVNTRWRTRNGTVIDIHIRTVADRNDRGEVVRFRSAALDLTEKNQLTNELRARGDELERTNQRLLAINTELEDFTYVVSHDLKEPLRTLQTYGQRLAEEYSAELGVDGFQYINHLIHASRRLGLLIDDLLHLSQAGRITHSAQPFDLIEAVATARQDLADLIQRREATVLTDGSLPRVVGDRQRITQLLTNLIANGLKYNRQAQPRVVIAAVGRREAGQPPAVVVSVRDNGIGIDPAFHKQIFGIFRRLHRSDEYEGTGAGLAICKKIVEAHGGRIWVESQPGAGATFFFTLPEVATVAEPALAAGPREFAMPRSGRLPRPSAVKPPRAEPAPRTARAPLTAAIPAGPRTILVEDDADTAHLIQQYSRPAGLSFLWFSTAEAAWKHLQDDQPELLLFDINLPGMSGIELCKRVRTLPALRETPVVMFEPDQSPERLAELRAAGADFFLSKELLIEPTRWQDRLHAILDQVRQPMVRVGG